jgi:hypothetical protein
MFADICCLLKVVNNKTLILDIWGLLEGTVTLFLHTNKTGELNISFEYKAWQIITHLSKL